MKKRSLVLSTVRRLKRKPELLIGITTLGFFLLLTSLQDNYKLAVVATMVVIALYYIITKNLFFSLFSTFIASVPFLLPAKRYEFEYASASEYIFDLWENGMIRSINLSISNLLVILIILFFLLETINLIVHIRSRAPHPFTTMFKLPLFTYISFCWVGYVGVSFYSSMYHSYFPTYSLYNLFENSKFFIGFIGIIYLFIRTKRFVKYIYVVLVTALLFHNVIGISQFATSPTPLSSSERQYSQDAEENIPLERVSGISYQANIHAFVILLLFIHVLPYITKRGKWFTNVVIFLTITNIILSQSRTAWLSVAVVIAYIFIVRREEVKKIALSLVRGKNLYRMIFLCVFAIIIMLPRLQTSSIFFTEEGGGGLRTRMILEGWQLLQESPFVGFGLGNEVKVFLNTYSDSYATTFPLYIHFAYLQMALESGMLGAIFFFLPFLIFVIKYARITNHPNNQPGPVLFCALCCIIILFVNFSLQPALGILEFYLIGIALGAGVLSLSKINPEIYL